MAHLERVVSLFRTIVSHRAIGYPTFPAPSTSKINRLASTRTPVPITLAFLINGDGRQRSHSPSRERLKELLQRHRAKRWAANYSTIRGSDLKRTNLFDASSDHFGAKKQSNFNAL